jgi:transcriptional regulator with XRE-family HTH domain
MGRVSREKPARLAGKLVQIRNALGLSQDGIISHMGLTERRSRDDISKYERGVREPSLMTLLKYAEAAGVWVDVLINDDLDLPDELPCPPKHEGVKRKAVSRSKKR